MKIEEIVFSCSILTGIIYAGKLNKKQTEFLEKKDVTAQVLGSTIQYVGENKNKTITFGNGSKYKITVEKLNDIKSENELL